MKRYFYSMLAASALVLGACGGSTETSENVETSNSSSEAAENISGKINFYTSQPDSDAGELVKAFNEQYPDINVEIFRSGTEEVISKIQAEKQAGEIQADVLLVADAVTFESLKEQELLLAYQSPEHDHIPAEFVDEDYTYAGTKVMATVLAVNTNAVNELPNSWQVLAGTDASGEGIMPSPLYSGAAAYNVGVLSRQNAFGWEFFEKLRDNDLTVVQGNGAVLQAVAAGEKTYGMVVDFIVARAKAEGSPIDLIYPEEGVPVITEPIGILSNTKNEAAAKAFVDFVLSEEGQTMSSELGYTPIREGVAAPEGLKAITDMKVVSHDIKELLKTRDEDKQRFIEILGE
ncbi:ABC transporter substrate-binding protein [Alkalihalobacterium chitinilyticum]|uniref:ABC transporter substrate-binding protein n=1 Tax=Alkalihalobacterium chitinilyticum TaxID=2980103 RepID=A0ABT5VEU8_9BACI|nr:ABC transporter substrate-binding protein [Alkalihalobacterium chitinilyticum]MDE5413995.1 ABC transporter substrate-binding protein [Alkalihalobacterium chitinilyticum]